MDRSKTSSVVGRLNRMFWRIVALMLLSLVGVLFSTYLANAKITSQIDKGGETHGFVKVDIRGQEPENAKIRQIFLPDISVYLKNTSTSALSPKVQTDLKGRFVIPRQPSGTYSLCWEAPGYIPGCSKAPLTIENLTVFPQPVDITPKGNVVSGRVTLKDGGHIHLQDPFFGVNSQTKVSLVDSAGKQVTNSVRVNNIGNYLITEVPLGTFKIIAQSEGIQVAQSIDTKPFNPDTKLLNPVNLILQNSRPRIMAVIAAIDGKGVRKVEPGATVVVTTKAEDVDGDNLTYKWGVSASQDTFTSVNESTVKWTLPKSKGLHSIYVMVSDRKGGYAIGKADISTNGQEVIFSGQVNDSDMRNISDATVSINGTKTQTNKAGYFSLTLPAESSRYVLSIAKPGYELLSKISNEGISGGKYRLFKAQKFVVDPTKEFRVAEKKENQRGAEVIINANSLVGRDNKLASTPLNFFISTIDQRDPAGRLPGDYAAINSAGKDVTLTSFGAVDIQVQDSAGSPFNLAPGKTATVRIPVDPKQLAAPEGPPKTIPLWFYEPNKGIWREEGMAKLVGNFYEGTVKHFSVLNVDVEKVNPACMRLSTDTTKLKLPFNVRITIPTGVGLDKVVTRTIADALSVIVRLPANAPIKLEVLDSANNPISLATQTVNSGAATGGPATPPYPYAVCTEALLTLATPSDGGFLDFIGLDDAATATAYYAAIDPANSKTTLDTWKTANGFNSGDEASAVYFNAGDLGFGRGMHLKTTGGNVAYYVTNYPTVEEARLNVNSIATVAMDYSALTPGGTQFTKFYVYGADGGRLLSADLDGRGQKFVPKLCITCHGGNPQALNGAGQYPDDGNVQAKFIPFDPESYEYSNVEIPPFSGTLPFGKAAQEPAFKTLNTRILDTDPTVAVRQLVEGWYGGAGLPSSVHNSNFVPPGWTTPVDKSSLYSNVVKNSCRACHTTRSGPIDWASYSGDLAEPNPGTYPNQGLKEYGDLAKYRVCTDRTMPNAKRTFFNFWLSTSPNRPAALGTGGLDGWSPTDACPSP
jgi:mono/diheme cytochrome c family protein